MTTISSEGSANSASGGAAAAIMPQEQAEVPSEIQKERVCGRTEGKVCICQGCEATRIRLLDRFNVTDNGKKRPRSNSIAQETEVDAKKKSAADAFSRSQEVTSASSAPQSEATTSDPDNNKLQTMAAACRTILECVGEDPDREGLIKTPERWAKALLFMCSGYDLTPEQVTNNAVFSENHNEMVVVRNIDIHSLCEHHMVPFTGRVHIGYIPNGKILGLSKLARIAELYARRLQVQERLTRQIADAVVEAVSPLGVAVVIECLHMCMVMRGVQKTGAMTTTSSVRGCFETNSKTRAEFFSIIQGNGGMKMC